MKSVKILDCTLRDGGYCNQWMFGKENIRKILYSLMAANIEIIECGFLSNLVESDVNCTRYRFFSDIAKVLPNNSKKVMLVCMINYGEYQIDEIPSNEDVPIDGLRVAFHKNDVDAAIKFSKALKQKGYKVFLQPMISESYSNEEFIDLIKCANEIKPYAFYIVDSLGAMKKSELIRLLNLVEDNLREDIVLGFHSHNNMQLAYSNAQTLVEYDSQRELIIDVSIFGMGRGAGNLNTELFVEYLNDNLDKAYSLAPLLIVIDEVLNSFYQKRQWGYSLPNYLSAKYKVHPNYARYLDEKNTLTIENMNDIFFTIHDEKRYVFDEEYIEELYIKFMKSGSIYEENLEKLKRILFSKKVLIIAPGKSSLLEKETILNFIEQNDALVICVNFEYAEYDSDFIFLSNLRRFKAIKTEKLNKCIVTSNIPSVDVFFRVRYEGLLNDEKEVRDNASLMLIALLVKLNVQKIWIAGLDGYSGVSSDNYVDESMNFPVNIDKFRKKNSELESVLNCFSKEIEIEFVTTQKHVHLV